MLLAGLQIPDRHALTLARLLRDAELYLTADRLETAYNELAEELALTVAERDEILQVLVDCPQGLSDLRAVLLTQQMWRAREGIS